LASLTHAIPREYGETLSVLQDKAEHRPFNEVVKVFRSEFGKSPDEMFVGGEVARNAL
jgi:aarF domain-containing kinase